MYTFRRSLLVLAALVLCAAGARAADAAEDDEGIIAREDAVEVMLLRQPAVQRDLKVSDDQARKIDHFATGQWRKVRGLRKLSEEERNRQFEAMAKDNETFLHDTLKPEQRKRLNQIAMQVAGLLWVMRSDVATALMLSDDQKQKIREAHKEAHREALAALRGAVGAGVRAEKFHELRQANRKRLMSILTDNQQKQWQQMSGEKFAGELHFGPRTEK
jgi:hypothetical protein